MIHRLIAEVIDELGMRERTIGVAPVGCAVFLYTIWTWTPRGRARPRAGDGHRPETRAAGPLIFTYQGDGDLAAIGGNEICMPPLAANTLPYLCQQRRLMA